MFQIATSLLFAVAALTSAGAILAMLKNNQAAIWSALIGHGAFPITQTPENGPAAQMLPQLLPLPRTSRRLSPRRSLASAQPQFSRAA